MSVSSVAACNATWSGTFRLMSTSCASSERPKINLFIAVDVVGQDNCPGIKQGGLLVMVRPEVELIVTAGEIPESITINVEGLEIGDTVTISSVTLPEGAKPTIDRDFVIANISAPSGLAGVADEEEEGEEVEGEEVEGEEAEEQDGDEE